MIHEPKLYCVDGPITANEGGSYTFAFVGCTCGWNSDGKSGNKEGDWAAHLGCQFHNGKPKEFCGECAKELGQPHKLALEHIEKICEYLRNYRLELIELSEKQRGSSRNRTRRLVVRIAKLYNFAALTPAVQSGSESGASKGKEAGK